MTISEKLQKHNFADISRGFRGHSISDKQKRPYREGKKIDYAAHEKHDWSDDDFVRRWKRGGEDANTPN